MGRLNFAKAALAGTKHRAPVSYQGRHECRMLELSGKESGVYAQAPRKEIPGRGFQRAYGQWGSNRKALRTALVGAVCVSRGRGNRVGFGGAAREHAGHQREWNVHRITRHTLDWSRIHGEIESRTTDEARLFRETDRTGARDGRNRGAGGDGKSPEVSAAAIDAVHSRVVSFEFATYTIHSKTKFDIWEAAPGNRRRAVWRCG
jgi:hypothetical protein